ncbi:ATP-binding protein [Bradyrhizobium shewense]|uniref:ATP-binding protein n=1 Tax=Bradyrhizobium shewense TaxID=1761772 RepID=UPI003D31ACBC
MCTRPQGLPGQPTSTYTRLLRLIEELDLARGGGRLPSRMKSIAAVDCLNLGDWGASKPSALMPVKNLLELLEARYGRRSTLVNSQLPIAKWHELTNDPTFADAIPRYSPECFALLIRRRLRFRRVVADRAVTFM